MNRIWLRKPCGYDKHILLADSPVEIGNSARLNNGYFEEDFVAIEKSDAVIADKKYIKVTMQGQDTKTFTDVYYRANRYTLFKETAEISEKAFKKHNGDIINALFEKDRDGMEAVKTFESREEALAELKNHRCTYCRTSGFASVYFYACEFWCVEEEEYNDEWELTGNSDYAEIETRED